MSRPQTTVFVSGLEAKSDESTLLNAFQPFGEIMEIHMPKQRTAVQGGSTEGGHRGFAFVVFSSAEEAEGAIDNMHLNEIDHRVVTVTLAKPFKAGANTSGPDARRPIWEDEVGDAGEGNLIAMC